VFFATITIGENFVTIPKKNVLHKNQSIKP
jgi:hypothetical protein